MSVCCTEHAKRGDPFRCYRSPKDEITATQEQRLAKLRKELDEWSARVHFEQRGMVKAAA